MTEASITISLNGETQNIPTGKSVHAFLIAQNTPQKGIAVAVNQKVVPRGEWENRIIEHQDSILIITATQGG